MTQLMDQIIHVRFDGRSEELASSILGLPRNASDTQIKQAVASHFDLPRTYLDGYVVVRSSNTIIVRLEAIYG
ncbi:MAG TPA: hypothetical protein VFB12_25310 [Ktedonobacteraceae bacterium]|nr:hypothetical protein [Ktedonobacteraceae bacterium]